MRLADVHDVSGELLVYGEVPDALRHELEVRAGETVTWTFCGFAESIDAMAVYARCPSLIPVWRGAGVKTRTAQMAGRGIPVFRARRSRKGSTCNLCGEDDESKKTPQSCLRGASTVQRDSGMPRLRSGSDSSTSTAGPFW